MNERRKLINWMAGVTTFIVVLLIVIVLLKRMESPWQRHPGRWH